MKYRLVSFFVTVLGVSLLAALVMGIPGRGTSDAVTSMDREFSNRTLYFRKAGTRHEAPGNGEKKKITKFYAETGSYKLRMNERGLVFEAKIEVGLVFPGANEYPEIIAVGKVKKRKTSKARAIVYKQVYPGIDLKIHGMEKQVEYDWIVKPGGYPSDIRFKYRGIEDTGIDNRGNLIIETCFGDLKQRKPEAYQIIEGDKVRVPCSFKNFGNHTYGFDIQQYNKFYHLVIGE